MPKLFESRANQMDKGLNLNTGNLPNGMTIGGTAYRYERGGGIMTAPGFRASSTVNTSTGCDGLETAAVFPAIWSKFGTKVKYSTDAVTFYDTGLTATTATDTDILEDGDGNIYVSNTVDTPTRIAVSKLVAAISAGATTISLGAEAQLNKFAATGTVRINETDYTYTGKNTGAGTLTGVQEGGGAVTTAQAVDSLVIQTTNPATWQEEKGDMLMTYQSRMIVGGVKYKEHIAYYSEATTAANPEYFYDFDTGTTGGSKIFTGKITGGIAGLGYAYIFTDKTVDQITGFDSTTFAMLTVPVSQIYGAYNRRCVVDMDGVIAFMGQRRLMPITLQLAPDSTTAPFLDGSFDDAIRPWLDSFDDDQTEAYLKWDSAQKILKIGGVVNGALQTYIFDPQANGGKGAFAGRENRSVGDSCMFKGLSYFGHRDDGVLYQDDIGRTNGGIAILHSWKTNDIEFDKGRQWMKAYKHRHTGWITQGTDYTFRIYIDGSSTASFEQTYSWEDLITTEAGQSIGTRGVGIGGIGGESSVLVYPFKNHILLTGLNGETFTFEWEVTGEGYFLQVDDWYFSSYLTRFTEHSFS